MATSNDKFKITIRIADLPDLVISIDRSEEEEAAYRYIVKEINKRWEKRRERFPLEDNKLSMAIIALRFAKQLYDAKMALRQMQDEQENRQNEIDKMLTQFEESIDNILLNIEE